MNQIASTNPASTIPARGQLFAALNQGLQLNQYNLPDYIYRADLIPLNYSDYPQAQKINILNAAALQLTFAHGYPAFNESTPFWEQLPSEPMEAFNAFLIYLELPEKSAHENPVRMLPMIAELTKIPLEELTAYAHIYYWHYRSRAYDLFIIACHRKQRELRLMSIEGKHFKLAEEMLEKVQKIASRKLDDALLEEGDDDTKLKDLVDMSMKLVQIQRMSVGLSSTGNQQIDVNIPRHAQSNDVMQHVAKESSNNQASTTRSREMDQLLSNPDDLAAIQDLIVRLNAPKTNTGE